jgi:hypothetical protein
MTAKVLLCLGGLLLFVAVFAFRMSKFQQPHALAVSAVSLAFAVGCFALAFRYVPPAR